MFLEALKNKNHLRPPVWIMRQAGRYLPSYRRLREKYSLKELFFIPELAAQITLMPVEQLGVDAAILFSDITVVALPLGYDLDFSEGPMINGKSAEQSLDPIFEAIKLIKQELKVPLIGFCGGPHTVASYIGSDLQQITKVTIEYVKQQQEAGVDAIQIFDSWADQIPKEAFQNYCDTYLKPIVNAVQVPVILFMRKASQRIEELVSLKPSAISFDWERPLCEIRKQVPMAVQGNLDPAILYEPFNVIKKKTRELIESMQKDPGFIANLGHGIRPDMSVDAVRCFIETVQNG